MSKAARHSLGGGFECVSYVSIPIDEVAWFIVNGDAHTGIRGVSTTREAALLDAQWALAHTDDNITRT